MKKLLSLALAFAMVLSLAAVAFAANDLTDSDRNTPSAIHVDGDHPMLLDANRDAMATMTDLPSFGKVVYYGLYAETQCLISDSFLYAEGAKSGLRVESGSLLIDGSTLEIHSDGNGVYSGGKNHCTSGIL